MVTFDKKLRIHACKGMGEGQWIMKHTDKFCQLCGGDIEVENLKAERDEALAESTRLAGLVEGARNALMKLRCVTSEGHWVLRVVEEALAKLASCEAGKQEKGV